MLKEKNDEFYDARLVATAKLHLPSVMNRQKSPFFFEIMIEIVERGVYRGYKTIKGREVKLSGIKDFIFNFHHGLGVRDLPTFLGNCAFLETKDTSKQKNVRRFIDWLKKEDPDSFQFPPSYWEFRRLRIAVGYMRGSQEKRIHYLNMIRIIYNTHPEILIDIGPGRKYQSIPEAYKKEGYRTDAQSNAKPIRLSQFPTYREVESLARELNSRLDKLKNRVLIAKLIEIYKINEAIEHHVVIDASQSDDE
jgi:hypothetical protein